MKFRKLSFALFFCGVSFLAQGAGAQTIGAKSTTQAPATPLDKAVLEKERVLSDFAMCVRKKIHVERLHCYDKMAVDYELATLEDFQKITRDIRKFGFWTFQIQEMTTNNEKSASLILRSNEAVDGGNGFTYTPELIVRCSAGRSDVILDWKRLLTNERRSRGVSSFTQYLDYRFDNHDKVAADWELSFDRRAMFASEPIKFVKQALVSQLLVVNVTPANGALVTVSFTLKGLKEGTAKLSEACYKGVKSRDEPVVVTPKVKDLILH